jgi:hypothetical protein
MVRVLLRDRDTELAATRIIHRRSTKLLDRCQVLVDLCGDDVVLNNNDVERAFIERAQTRTLNREM